MKKNEIEKLDKLKQEKVLPEEKKQELKKMIFNNLINAISILLFLVVLMTIPIITETNIVIMIYRISSLAMLLFAIFLFEKAYNKDDGMLALNGIEMLILSIIVLFAPYAFIKMENKFFQLSGIYYAIYYIIKAIIIYVKETKKHLKTINDIQEIVKKESEDKIKKEKQEEQTKKRKRGRPRKENK